MLLHETTETMIVSCGDTSTTVVANLLTGFTILLNEEDWSDDEDWPPVRWSHGLSGFLPEEILQSLRDCDSDGRESLLYGLAHDTECEPKSFQDLIDFHLEV